MEEIQPVKESRITKALILSDNPSKAILTIVIISIILGVITGFILSNKGKDGSLTSTGLGTPPKNAQADTRTFRDFAEGVIKTKPKPSDPGEYTEGTHLLQREGAVPVALTSSVVDLSKYEDKKVKVYGETQKALKEGWLMDVGRVEEIE